MLNNKHPYFFHISAFLLCTFFTIIVIYISYVHYSQSKSKSHTLLSRITSIETEIETLQHNNTIATEFSAPFYGLVANGFYGSEDRLLWGESLKTLAEERKLADLKYAIGPQKRITDIGSDFPPQLALSQSVMEVNAGLGHEGDFLAITESLSSLPGFMRIQSCRLSKVMRVVLLPYEKNINLNCYFSWFSVLEKENDDTSMITEDMGDI